MKIKSFIKALIEKHTKGDWSVSKDRCITYTGNRFKKRYTLYEFHLYLLKESTRLYARKGSHLDITMPSPCIMTTQYMFELINNYTIDNNSLKYLTQGTLTTRDGKYVYEYNCGILIGSKR